MITLAAFTLNFLHPGFLLGKGSEWRKKKDGDSNRSSVDEIVIEEQKARK